MPRPKTPARSKSPVAKKSPAKAASPPAAAKSATKKTPARSSKKKQQTPPPSANTLSEDDEEVHSSDFDSDDDESYPDWMYDMLFYEPDDFATKLALRLLYMQTLPLAALMLVFPAMAGSSARLSYLGASEFTTRVLGIMLLNVGMLLVAAAQSDYWAQKKALQYRMVGFMAGIVVLISELAKGTMPSSAKESALIWLVSFLLNLGLILWACYYYKGNDELGEDDEQQE